ncbi:MAG TPA: peptidylprolyl isomerase [Dongiaceae bacterium]|nr:peptidylprolyl isomerase [Dongiaceae bacterium]
MTILSVPRRPEAVRFLRSRFRSEAQWQPPAIAEPERDRLAMITTLAERAGIGGALPELLRDPRLVGVIAGHFRVPMPSAEACRRYYRDHLDEFRQPDRYLGRQILLPLATGDVAAEPEVWARAERIIAILSFTPRMFPDLLVSYGAAAGTGQLGPVARGALPAALDAMFFTLRPGEICPVPIATEQGVHVVMLDRILPGEAAPFAAMHGRVSFLLRQEMRLAAATRHLARLAERYRAAAGD